MDLFLFDSFSILGVDSAETLDDGCVASKLFSSLLFDFGCTEGTLGLDETALVLGDLLFLGDVIISMVFVFVLTSEIASLSLLFNIEYVFHDPLKSGDANEVECGDDLYIGDEFNVSEMRKLFVFCISTESNGESEIVLTGLVGGDSSLRSRCVLGGDEICVISFDFLLNPETCSS